MVIRKEYQFASAHRLANPHWSDEKNREVYGKCFTTHGHTYRLQLSFSGLPDDSGMVVNFHEISRVVRETVLDIFDHHYLNDLAEFKELPPTAENIALISFGKIQEGFAGNPDVHLERVLLYETQTASVVVKKGDFEAFTQRMGL